MESIAAHREDQGRAGSARCACRSEPEPDHRILSVICSVFWHGGARPMSDDPQPPRPPIEGVEYQPQPPQIDPAILIFRRDLFTATPRIFVTHLIVAANVAMFVLMVLTGPGALFDPSPS